MTALFNMDFIETRENTKTIAAKSIVELCCCTTPHTTVEVSKLEKIEGLVWRMATRPKNVPHLHRGH